VSNEPNAPAPNSAAEPEPHLLRRIWNWFTRENVEAELKRLGRYPLAPVQVGLYVLVALGVVGGELGAGDLFWHEHGWHQFAVGFAVSWLFGTVLYVTILLLPPRALPGAPNDADSFRVEGRWVPSLFYSANPGVRQIGRRVLLWLIALVVVVYAGKWLAVLSNYDRSADTTSVSVFGSQWFGSFFLLGYAVAILFGMGASRLAASHRVKTTKENWLRDAFDRPEVRVPTEPYTTADGDTGTSLPGNTVLRLLRTREQAQGDQNQRAVPAAHETAAVNNLHSLFELHALAYGFGLIILVALALCTIQLAVETRLLSPVAFITLYVILLNVLGGFVVFRFAYYRQCALLAVVCLCAANSSSGSYVPYVLLAAGAWVIGTRVLTVWRFGALFTAAVLAFGPARAEFYKQTADWLPFALTAVVLVGYLAFDHLARAANRAPDGVPDAERARAARRWRWAARLCGWLAGGLFFCFGNAFGCKPFPMTYDGIGWKQEHAAAPTAAYDGPRPLTEWTGQQPDETPPRVALITAKELLDTFHTNHTAKNTGAKGTSDKPRLVLVAVSGGGIRAAVWTGVVFEGLERELGTDFRDRVRIVTGASGGMVGASAYAAKIDMAETAGKGAPTQNARTGLFPFAESLARDSLSPVAQTMLVRDFTWNTLFPNRYERDRGRTLEDAWHANFTRGHRYDEDADARLMLFDTSPFERPMRALAAQERACRRPSLVFAPIMVEDTKRLLVSNLDLGVLTFPVAHRLDVKENPADAPLARPAVEFFRLFPYSDAFAVGSAARMSASFPVVSPAVALPTNPVRRVVDAGYYDNYGIDILSNWLLANKADVLAHTSGVLIVQVRAYPLEKGGATFEDGSEGALDLLIGAVSAPLSAVFTARGSAAYHRNNQQIAELHRAFNTPGAHPQARSNFFATTVFELQQNAALSWYLTTAQKRQVAEGFYKKGSDGNWAVRDDVQKQMSAMKDWFQKP
jgi:Patatin-like phospholipase